MNRTVPEEIARKVNVFARIEHMDSCRVSEDVNVTAVRWKISSRGVDAEQLLDSALLEPPPETDEERVHIVRPALEVLA